MSESPRKSGKSSRPVHIPVLLRETLHHLQLELGQIVVDGTVGAAGHSAEILKRIGPEGTLIGLDRDPMMLGLAGQKLTAPNCRLMHSSYAQLETVLADLQISAVDRILLDLGLSSDQLADDERGFSFDAEGPLDLRFDTSRGEPAWKFLEKIDEAEFADIVYKLGEETNSRKIARHFVAERAKRSITSARDLSNLVAEILPRKEKGQGTRHPATQVFQALRIAVNQELQQLEAALQGVLLNALKPGGIVVVISFHSLEDRLVKQAFRDEKSWQLLTSKPVIASTAEQRINPRSRTAKLRAARKN